MTRDNAIFFKNTLHNNNNNNDDDDDDDDDDDNTWAAPLSTMEGNLCGGIGSRPVKITPHNGVGTDVCMSDHNLFSQIWKTLLLVTPGHFQQWRNLLHQCEPQVKKLHPTCADRAANPNFPVHDVIALRSTTRLHTGHTNVICLRVNFLPIC